MHLKYVVSCCQKCPAKNEYIADETQSNRDKQAKSADYEANVHL